MPACPLCRLGACGRCSKLSHFHSCRMKIWFIIKILVMYLWHKLLPIKKKKTTSEIYWLFILSSIECFDLAFTFLVPYFKICYWLVVVGRWRWYGVIAWEIFNFCNIYAQSFSPLPTPYSHTERHGLWLENFWVTINIEFLVLYLLIHYLFFHGFFSNGSPINIFLLMYKLANSK